MKIRVGILVGITAGLVGMPRARALPQYSLKEGKQCVYCHYDARGGGPTNARGRYYAEHFTLEGYVEKEKKKKKHRARPSHAKKREAPSS